MVKTISHFLNQILSFSLILFLLANCGSNSKDTSMMDLKTLFGYLKEKEDSSSKEEKNYIDLSNINKDLYNVLSYKERKPLSYSNFANENKNQIHFNVDIEQQNKWKPIPDSGKINIKTEHFLLFSLKGIVEIGEVGLKEDKKSKKVTLSSIMGGEKETKNFKYLVLSLSSKKSGKLEIKDSDIEKLKDKKINFKKEPEDFVKDSVVEKALEGKKKATQKDIFGYDVDESILIKNIRKKFNSISETQIKELDSITESIDVYASDTKPIFASESYTINGLTDVSLTYIENSINQDDIAGTLSYEVDLSVSRIDEKRKIQVSYSGFKSTNEKQTKFNSIYVSDIKNIDGITPDKNRYPSEYSEPQFNSNPYMLKGLNDVTVTYVKDSIKQNDYTGILSYKVELSTPKLIKRRVIVRYRPIWWSSDPQLFRDLFAELNLFKSINVSHIKALDGITPDKNVYPSAIPELNFNSNPYTFNNLPKEWIYGLTSLGNVTITYVRDSMKTEDMQGVLSYQVELSFPRLKKRTLSIVYREEFKGYLSQTVLDSKSTLAIRFYPDGKKLVSGACRSGEGVKIWDFSTRSVLKTFGSYTLDLDISPDGTKIVSNSCYLPYKLRLWDAQTGSYLKEFPLNGYERIDRVREPIFSPDGKKISAGVDSYHIDRWLPPVIVWNLVDGSVFQKLSAKVHSNKSIVSVRFSPDSSKIFTASTDNKIRIWNTQTGSLVKTINISFSPYALEVSSDGNKILVAGKNSSIGVLDIATGTFSKWYSGNNLPRNSFYHLVKFSSDNSKIVAGSYRDNQIFIWDVNNTSPSKVLTDYNSRFVNDLAISPDGEKIVTASNSNMKIWEDTRDGKTILDE